MSARLAHPAKAILASRRMTQEQIAHTLGVSRVYVNLALNGRLRTSSRFRAAVAQMLGMPESEVFSPEMSHVIDTRA